MTSSRQFSFALGSQLASAFSNFLLTLAIVQTGEADEVAEIVLAQIVYGFGIGSIRLGLYRKSLVDRDEEASRIQIFLAGLLGLTLALFLALFAILRGSWPIGVFAVAMPFLAVTEAIRQALLVGRRTRAMAALDIAWLALFAIFLLTQSSSEPTNLVAGWAIAGLLPTAALARLVLTRWAIGRKELIGNFIENWPAVAEVLVLRGTPLAALLLVSATVDFEEFGSWSAFNSLFGPLNLAFSALSSVGLTFVASSSHLQRAVYWRVLVACSFLLPLISIAWAGAVVFGYLDRPWGPEPPVAIGLRPFALPVALYVSATGVVLFARMFTHASGLDDARSLRLQVASSLVLGLSLVAGSPFGMMVVAWTGVFGSFAASVIWAREWSGQIGEVPRISIAADQD